MELIFNFLHNYHPKAILFYLGMLNIYWYGLGYVAGIFGGILIILKLNNKIEKIILWDLFFWLIIFGLLGARFYYVILNFEYYWQNPLDIFKIWQGGMAIYGAIIAGLITLFFYCRRCKLNFWFLCDIFAFALVFGQMIGRWGNYFNQELYGLPTNLAWGIPIDLKNRIVGYENFDFFHPTFLYESLGCLIILLILFFLYKKIPRIYGTGNIFLIYLILYSTLRFILEFLRIDSTLIILGIRWSQILSIILILISVRFLYRKKYNF
ncbi:prolipoprotein diacylglyceryl transferase [Candidatus Kuenenbacteria bacterium HGW-Kuenenbacteria-1]|uniref:Phosphatidylglycerol--prolipoprotein diacylglyceryl transferase n=1 Tax=Candidatus Kuenenbacteria bacterium HGW-Kuenenbacteria-1 TaxID=2013812 RepID=A0A2N1UNP6_9BACT|nr:MAG: prolipoprotein diacylglyceryl transferase [Candidatus Kuenenbacteria bacterium HGW-Kuenenbacteria-1]